MHFLIADEDEDDLHCLVKALHAAGIGAEYGVFKAVGAILDFIQKKAEVEGDAFRAVLFLNDIIAKQDSLVVMSLLKEINLSDRVFLVVLTDEMSVTRLRRAYAMGANSFLAKPINPIDIRNLVQAFPEFFQPSETPLTEVKSYVCWPEGLSGVFGSLKQQAPPSIPAHLAQKKQGQQKSNAPRAAR